MSTQVTTTASTLAGAGNGDHEGTASMLNPDDVCDRCGVRAYVLVVFEDGSELTFCGHHGRQYGEVLMAAALLVHDETARLASPQYLAPTGLAPLPAR